MASAAVIVPVLFVLLAAGMTGCIGAGGLVLPSHYYRLDLPATPSDVTAPAPSPAKVLLRVQLADALKGPKIVEAKSDYELAFMDSHRWGEPLGRGISRLVAAQLKPGFADVQATPIQAGFESDYRVDLTVEKLWGMPNGDIVLDARWMVTDAHEKPLTSGHYTIRQKGWDSGDYRAYAERVSKLMAGLSKEILATIVKLEAQEAKETQASSTLKE